MNAEFVASHLAADASQSFSSFTDGRLASDASHHFHNASSHTQFCRFRQNLLQPADVVVQFVKAFNNHGWFLL
jgi:hypothetical protein